MVSLRQIVSRAAVCSGSIDIEISGLSLDSRQIAGGYVFFASGKGNEFIDSAIASGAVAVVSENAPNTSLGCTWVQVEDVPQTMGEMASAFFGHPAQKIKAVAVTGTNGKTTTATLLHQMAQALGEKAGLISTVENRIGNKVLPATHTTPNSIEVHRLMSEMVEKGCTYCFMEASSHGLHQKRLAGVKLAGGIFTNISHDHLDYHKTFDNYIKAKKLLFDQLPSDAFALVNKDDRRWAVMLQNCTARAKTYALRSTADYQAHILENTFEGLNLKIQGTELWTPLIGEFNAYNLLCVYGAAIELGFEHQEVLEHLSQAQGAAGRFEQIFAPNGLRAVVDYAHTPDALENVLKTLTEIKNGGQKIICVVGCGGDRDKEKRPLMASISARYAQIVILTSDNPRSEDPQQIIDDMLKGIPKNLEHVFCELDREKAIELAAKKSNVGDVILIAGKGHENYQEIKGIKYPFDDREIAKRKLEQK